MYGVNTNEMLPIRFCGSFTYQVSSETHTAVLRRGRPGSLGVKALDLRVSGSRSASHNASLLAWLSPSHSQDYVN